MLQHASMRQIGVVWGNLLLFVAYAVSTLMIFLLFLVMSLLLLVLLLLAVAIEVVRTTIMPTAIDHCSCQLSKMHIRRGVNIIIARKATISCLCCYCCCWTGITDCLFSLRSWIFLHIWYLLWAFVPASRAFGAICSCNCSCRWYLLPQLLLHSCSTSIVASIVNAVAPAISLC